MENKLFQDIPQGSEREAHLDANCVRPEEMQVKKHFNEAEMTSMRRDYANGKIELKKEEERLAQIKKDSDLKMKATKESVTYNELNIRFGFVEVKQQVYLFADQTAGMMNYYDADGELVHSRRLEPIERQLGMPQQVQTS